MFQIFILLYCIFQIKCVCKYLTGCISSKLTIYHFLYYKKVRLKDTWGEVEIHKSFYLGFGVLGKHSEF